MITKCSQCPILHNEICTRKPGHRIDIGPLGDNPPPGWCPMAEVYTAYNDMVEALKDMFYKRGDTFALSVLHDVGEVK